MFYLLLKNKQIKNKKNIVLHKVLKVDTIILIVYLLKKTILW